MEISFEILRLRVEIPRRKNRLFDIWTFYYENVKKTHVHHGEHVVGKWVKNVCTSIYIRRCSRHINSEKLNLRKIGSYLDFLFFVLAFPLVSSHDDFEFRFNIVRICNTSVTRKKWCIFRWFDEKGVFAWNKARSRFC